MSGPATASASIATEAETADSTADTAKTQTAASRRPAKSAAAFRTISEVATELDVPQHVLRFWETKFSQVKPLKRGGGRRYYRPEDIELLRTIRKLLYGDGYTIKGVQKLLREGGLKAVTGGAGAARLVEVTDRAEVPAAAPQEPAEASPPAAVAAPAADQGPRGLDPQTREVLSSLLTELESLKSRLAKVGQ